MKLLHTILLVTACWTAGCGEDFDGYSKNGWEPDLRDIAMEYVEDASHYNLPSSRLGQLGVLRRDNDKVDAFRTEGENWVGACFIWKGKRTRRFRGEIYIKTDVVGEELKRVVYHELTHCIYEQDHFGEYGDIQYPELGTTIPWEDAKVRLFSELERRLRSLR